MSLLLTWTLELSAPATSSLMTQSCVARSACWGAGMPSRGALTGVRGGPLWTSGSAAGPSAKLFTWIRGNLKLKYSLGWECIESSPGEKNSHLLVDEKLNKTQQCALTAQNAKSVRSSIKSSVGQQQEEGSDTLLLCSCVTLPGLLGLALGPPVKEKCWPVWCPEEGYKDDPRAETPLLCVKAERNGIVLPGKEKFLWIYYSKLCM